MGVRFRKSFKVAPGIKINVSKSGLSTSVGGKGLTANFGKKGTRVTAGLPGSGLSVSKNYPHSRKPSQPQSYSLASWLICGLVVITVFVFVASR